MNIAIIMLGADGTVVRTISIVKAIKDKYKDAKISWITRGDVSTLIDNLPFLNKVYTLPYKIEEKFDILYNLDIDKEATLLAEKINADKKYGFYSEGDFPAAYTSGGEYYLNTLFDDELKKNNKKTFQEMMFEIIEIPYKKERYQIILTDKDRKYASDFIKENGIKTEKLIGVNMGASSRWPSKAWSEEKVKEFVKLAKNKDYEILLFGGPQESKKHEELSKELEKQKINIYRNNPNNSKREFASLVSICKFMVCPDSFSMHVSIALGIPTIGLFFCTSPAEIEGYNVLTKVVSPQLKEFFPERMNEYNEDLVNSISAEEVFSIVTNNNK